MAMLLLGCGEASAPPGEGGGPLPPPADPCEELAKNGKEIVALDSMTNVTMALLADGTSLCWGNDDWGQCAIPNPNGAIHGPRKTTLSCTVEISLTDEGGIARTATGDALVWSQNAGGELGPIEDPSAPPGTPVKLLGFSNLRAVAAGGRGLAVVDAEGAVWWWGLLWRFQETPLRLDGMPPVIDIALSGGNLFGLTEDGAVWGVGITWFGQLGDALVDLGETDIPVQIQVPPALAVMTDGYSCALTRQGEVWCWGLGDEHLGRDLPDPMGENPPILGMPAPTIPFGEAITIDGQFPVCAVRADHRLFCWGSNFYEMFGPESEVFAPVLVEGVDQVAQVSTGFSHICTLRLDGSVWCAGSPNGRYPLNLTGWGPVEMNDWSLPY